MSEIQAQARPVSEFQAVFSFIRETPARSAREALELPGYVEITAGAEGFALETTVTLAVNELFNDAASCKFDIEMGNDLQYTHS